MSLYSVFKSIAFKLDPEFIHDMSIYAGSKLSPLAELFSPLPPDPKFQLEVNQLKWNFPVGLAAGFDKNAAAINFFDKMGLGAIEVGTVTRKAQEGNSKPRIWRIPESNSIRNAMGFPNQGAEKILDNLKNTKRKPNLCLGVNIGKNKDTNEIDTPNEYAYLFECFAEYCDYLVINISSPNTPGLRSFQKKELLAPILAAVNHKRENLAKPLFIKISPDMEDDDIKMICELSKEFQLSGVIATNTTIQHQWNKGGLSGDYLKKISQVTRKKVCECLSEDPTQTIIGVGGITTYAEIKDFWKQGGSFVQVYTGLIYHGPELLKSIAKDIEADIKKYQVNNTQELYQLFNKQSQHN